MWYKDQMPESQPNIIDYVTLLAATIGAAAPILNWIHEKNKRNEHFDVGVEWKSGHDRSGCPAEFPCIIVHNRSETAIAINDVNAWYGWIFPKRSRYTLLDYEDPFDLDFPYKIEPGAFWTHRLSLGHIPDLLKKVRFARFAWLFGRSSIWIGVSTLRGSKHRSNLSPMIEFKNRPSWMQHQFV